jgi:phosphoribosylformylglycinamidine synthase
VIETLESSGRVVFRYATASGEVTDEANPNGSVHNIAGICSELRNVVGMMPHPERACEIQVGSRDGLVILESVVHALSTRGALQAVAR